MKLFRNSKSGFALALLVLTAQGISTDAYAEGRIRRFCRSIMESLRGERSEERAARERATAERAALEEASPAAQEKRNFLAIQEFKKAFPDTVKFGDLDTRMEQFAQKWPDNVRFEDGVIFKMEETSFTSSKRRSVVAISTHGLSEQKKTKLMRDYLDAISVGTVSFPLGEQAGHLYTRLGDKTLDFISSVSAKEYRVPSEGSKRLETVLSLDPKEQHNLRIYAQNAETNSSSVVGGFNYGGIEDGTTRGTLTDNRPTTPNTSHNCTSWVCTAPIGSNNKPLMELAGLPVSYRMHTNPGWWSSYVATAAREDRVPFLIYWTPDKVTDMEATLTAAKEAPFNWNFGRH